MTGAPLEARPQSPAIDYQAYRFGRRQRLYRGPEPDLSGRYIAFLGSERTFGKMVREPFPTLVAEAMGVTAANLAVEGAGAGFALDDPIVLEACCKAEVCVVEVTGMWNVSNRLYSVGRRYNRRVRAVSPLLRSIYPKIDFESYDYVGRMLQDLNDADPEKFLMIERECRDAWMVRARQLVESIETRTILFWFSERPPACLTRQESRRALSIFPEGVEADMLDRVKPVVDAYVECVIPIATPASAAPALPSPRDHETAANLLSRKLMQMLDPAETD